MVNRMVCLEEVKIRAQFAYLRKRPRNFYLVPPKDDTSSPIVNLCLLKGN